MAIITRQQITLQPGQTTIAHGLSDVILPQNVMVIPLPPVVGWTNIVFVGQPTATSVVFDNSGGLVIVNVQFRYVHTLVGVEEADVYV